MPARVTVSIPTYDRTIWIKNTILSVLGQTFDDFVLQVVDDASPSRTTEDVVAEFDDPRIELVRNEHNLGIVGNFNRSLQLARTEYLLQLGDDDELAPEFLDATVAVLDRRPEVGLVHSAFDLIGPEGELLMPGVDWAGGVPRDTVEPGREFVRASIDQGCRVCSSTALFRTAAAPSGGFRAHDFPPFDFAFWLELATSWDVAFVKRPLCRYRIHRRSHSSVLGDVTAGGYLHGDEMSRAVHRIKLEYLARHQPPDRERLTRMADRALRRDLLARARASTSRERRLRAIVSELVPLVREHPALLREPPTWRLLAGGVLGRRGVSALRRLRERAAAGRRTGRAS
jgi:glycosyltransferase involved in cell wall biosynthesis